MTKLSNIILYFAILSGVVIGVLLSIAVPAIGVILVVAAIVCGFFTKTNSAIRKIKIKYFESDLEPIEKISKGDWIDLRAAERVELKAGDYRLIRLGVGMILPDGYEAHILPRSSTPNKFGIMIANSMGVIDNSYSGDGDEWKCPAFAIRNTVIEKGDRIAQFRIVRNQPPIIFERVTRLRSIDRGGIGSTGTR